VFLCGLAGDVCVAWSAEDAAALGYATFVVDDATRGIAMPVEGGGTTQDAARARLLAKGVRYVSSGDLV
jgi:nicotinamidase/pyrazinamidase